MQSKTKKRLTGIVATVSAAALLLTGTFAWKDFRQHSVNVFEGKSNPDVTLNDKFDPPKSWNTNINSVVDKKVSVTNTANSSSPVFVRVRFSEYMESFKVKYDKFIMDKTDPTVTVLFATYASGAKIGEYLEWDTQAEAVSGLAALGLNLTPYAVDHDNDASTADKWYARTVNEELKNGVYGKPMQDPAATHNKEKDKLFGAVERVPLKQDVMPDNFPYKAHTWDGNSINDSANAPHYNAIGDDTKNTISDYINWDMGLDTKTQAKWKTDGKKPEQNWVLAPDGWCYWASILPVNTTTSMLMEAVRLTKMPGDAMDYEIHIEMQAITPDELDNTDVWKDMDSELRDKLKNSVSQKLKLDELKALIDHLKTYDENKYTPETWKTMKDELGKAELLVVNPNATQAQIDAEIIALTTAKNGLKLKAGKSNLQTLISQVEALRQKDYNATSWSKLQDELAKAKAVMNDPSATQQEVDNAYNALLDAKTKLVPMADKSALINAINDASQFKKEDWNTDTWKKFNDSLEAARKVRDTDTATAAEVKMALDNLREAQLGLRADKTALDALIDSLKDKKQGTISNDLWNKFTEKLNDAKAVSNNTAAKQGEVDKARQDLQKAFDNLSIVKGSTITMSKGSEWIVLDVQDGKMFIMSKEILETRKFHGTNQKSEYPTWAASEMRNYINSSTFMNKYLTAEEQARIATTTITTKLASNSQTYGSTDDKIYLLSRKEAEAYMPTASERLAVLDRSYHPWWLRSPRLEKSPDIVKNDGTLFYQFCYVAEPGIRPVMWFEI